jgi:hypothetical protein
VRWAVGVSRYSAAERCLLRTSHLHHEAQNQVALSCACGLHHAGLHEADWASDLQNHSTHYMRMHAVTRADDKFKFHADACIFGAGCLHYIQCMACSISQGLPGGTKKS